MNNLCHHKLYIINYKKKITPKEYDRLIKNKIEFSI